jgi:RimJ/RimL family protein N-acetyltransferase
VILRLFDAWCVRSLELADAEAIAKYANNRRVSINLRDSFPYPYTLDDARKWLRICARRERETEWAIARLVNEHASSSEYIGGVGVHPMPDVYRLSAEVGYWLAEPFWGKGIATAAVKAVVNYVFTDFEFIRLHAGVFAWNPASARVLEKAGFSLESRMRKAVLKDGKIVDQLMYVVLREEWTATH